MNTQYATTRAHNAQQRIEVAMKANSMVLAYTDEDTDMGTTFKRYEGNATVRRVAGTGEDIEFNVTSIAVTVDEDNNVQSVGITHTFNEGETLWMYKDAAVARAVSELVGVDLVFAESGMQTEFYMYME